MKQKLYLDASSLTSAGKCFLKLKRRIVDGYADLQRNFKMEYGTAGHKFIAHWKQTGDISGSLFEALQYYASPDISIPSNDYRNATHLSKTCIEYAETYKNDSVEVLRDLTGRLMIEQKWVTPQPFYEDDLYEIYLFGMIDLIGIFQGQKVFLDHKFSSNRLPASEYFKIHRLAPQLRMYKLGMRLLEEHYGDPLELHDAQPMLDVIFLAKDKNAYQRSEVMEITEEDLNEFDIMLTELCVKFCLYLKKAPYLRQGILNGSCRSEFFSLCEYYNVCDAPDPETAKTLLQMNYHQREHTPDMFEQEG